MDFPALGLTLRLAGTTTLVLLLVATPLAAWIAGGSGWLRRMVQAVVALPLVLPPTVLGFYLLVGMAPGTMVGRALIRLVGHSLAFTFWGLVVGSVVYSLPFAVVPLVTGFSNVNRELRETASVLGAGPLTVFRRIVVPLSGMSFAMAAVLAFAHTVGEFGVVLMIGGDIPGVTRTLSISIFDAVQEANYAGANRMAVWLVAVSFVALLGVYWRGARVQGSGSRG